MRIRSVEKFAGTVSGIFGEAIERLDRRGIQQRDVIPVFNGLIEDFTTPKSGIARLGDVAWTFAFRGLGMVAIDGPLMVRYVGTEAVKVAIDRARGKYMPPRDHMVNQ